MAKADRERLHDKLLMFCSNVYFQPPSSTKMVYPCIVYNKSGVDTLNANNRNYKLSDVYQVTVIDRDPDTVIPETLVRTFSMCSVTTTFVSDNLNHTVLTLYY